MCHVAMVGLDVISYQDVTEKSCSEWDPEALNIGYLGITRCEVFRPKTGKQSLFLSDMGTYETSVFRDI